MNPMPDLDRLAAQARQFLLRWHLQRELRQACATALAWMFVGPLVLVLVQAARAWVQGPQPPVSLWLLIGLALLGPLLYIAVKMALASGRYSPGRHTGLALFDAQLDSRDRLVTADEFMSSEDLHADAGDASRGFMQAAVEDAGQFIHRALQTALNTLPMPDWQVRRASWIGVAAAVAAAVLLAFGLGGVSIGPKDTINKETLAAVLESQSTPGVEHEQRLAARREARRSQASDQEELTAEKQTESAQTRQQRSQREEAALGQANAGSSSATQSSSNSSNAAGQPSSEKNASKPKPQEQQPETDSKRPDANAKKRPKPPQQNTRLAMESTTGEGKSSGSSSSLSQFETPEQQDKASPGTKQEDQSQDSEDEDEEEKSNSVARPDLRDRKAPVDRNAGTKPTGNEVRNDANGRGGPGARKKTRGVPSMILGIPIADRVQGKASPGRSKVTQENAKPTTESHPLTEAQARLARNDPAGHVDEFQLLPWMQNLIRDYFIHVHEQTSSEASNKVN